MKSNLNVIKFLILALFLSACSKDDDGVTENEISVVTIYGKPDSGKQLVGFYNVSGFSEEEYKSAVVVSKWWRADDAEGTNAVMISDANAIKYTPTVKDLGKFVAVELSIENTTNMSLRSNFIGPITKVVNKDGVVASAIDTQLFSQIKRVDDILISEAIWPGYTLTKKPMYLVHKDAEGNADKAFIINPETAVAGAITVPDGEDGSLTAVRYDAQAQEAFNAVNTMGNGLFDFDYTIDGKNTYYVQIYTDEEVLAGEQLATLPGGFFNPNDYVIGSIDFIIHEPFHEYQEKWTFSGGTSLPTITQESLELKALTHQIFKNFPNGNPNQTILENKLKQFVAIRSAENTILDSDMYSNGEKLEGTPRYIEKIVLQKAFPSRATEPFISGSILDDNYGITDRDILTRVIENLQYEIGASVYLALKQFKVDAYTEIEAGKTQFDISRDYFSMTKEELDQQLENAKKSVDFDKIKSKAIDWMAL